MRTTSLVLWADMPNVYQQRLRVDWILEGELDLAAPATTPLQSRPHRKIWVKAAWSTCWVAHRERTLDRRAYSDWAAKLSRIQPRVERKQGELIFYQINQESSGISRSSSIPEPRGPWVSSHAIFGELWNHKASKEEIQNCDRMSTKLGLDAGVVLNSVLV